MKKVFFILTATVFASCGTEPGKTDERQELIAHIDSLNKKMFNQQTIEFDKSLALKGAEAYHQFAEKYPSDSLTAEYMFCMADLYKGLADYNKAIQTLADICKKYPDYKKVPESIFLQGFYYQEYFGDTASAHIYYRELLAKYPSHPFAKDAGVLLTKTDEEIYKSFEEKKP